MLMNNRIKLNQGSSNNNTDNDENRSPMTLNNDTNNNDTTNTSIKNIDNDIPKPKPVPKGYKAVLIDDSHVTATIAAKILKLMNFEVFTATDAKTGTTAKTNTITTTNTTNTTNTTRH